MSPAPDARQSALHADLLDALGGDPFVRYDVDPGTLETVAVRPGLAGAWVGLHRSGVRWCTGLAAEPTSREAVAASAALVTGLADDAAAAGHPVLGVTVTRGGRALLPARFQAPEAWEWDHWWTDTVPEVPAYAGGPAQVVDLDPSDARIAALLEAASPTASIPAGDPRVLRWAGIELPGDDLRGTGGLAALVAVTGFRSGARHLNDVATHPARRGGGLARTLCAAVTAQSLGTGAPAVTLGMYADNDAARRVYAAIGFRFTRGQTSGRIAAVPAG